jgi:hypothetical protein
MRNFIILLVAFALGMSMAGCGTEKTEVEKLEEAVTNFEESVTFDEAEANLETIAALAARLEKWSKVEIIILYPPQPADAMKNDGAEELLVALSNP